MSERVREAALVTAIDRLVRVAHTAGMDLADRVPMSEFPTTDADIQEAKNAVLTAALAARPASGEVEELRQAKFGARRFGEECDRMQAFVREFNVGDYGESVFEAVRKEVLVLRAQVARAGPPSATCPKCYACPVHVSATTPPAAAQDRPFAEHACMTGDCEHGSQGECDHALADEYRRIAQGRA